MSEELRIEAASQENFDDLLALIAAYQTFYKVDDIDSVQNRIFFSQFLSKPEDGQQFIAYHGDMAVGFTTLYFPYSSTQASRFALMNDLFVTYQVRGQGIGAALIEKAREVAAANGFDSLAWMTAKDNATAQHLYDRFDVHKSAWYEYTVAAKADT